MRQSTMVHNPAQHANVPVSLLMIEVSAICDAQCLYCPRGAGLLDRQYESLISMEVLDKALALARGGHNHAIYLHHGGEPFLHPELPAIVHRVREFGFHAYLATNLISATPERVKGVLEAGLNQLEMHYSAGLTQLDHAELLERIQLIGELNRRIRNGGCKLEVNFGLAGETKEEVKAILASYPFADDISNWRWFHPHDWPNLSTIADRAVDYRRCEWFQQRCGAVLANGDLVICCLDQFRHSRQVSVLEVDHVEWKHLMARQMCRGCVQHVEMGWLTEDGLQWPPWLTACLEVDSWTV